MDISLSNKPNGTQIKPTSIHGILWLQTHFESDHWDLIAKSQVKIQRNCAENLAEDALQAGISVDFLPSFSNLKNFD